MAKYRITDRAKTVVSTSAIRELGTDIYRQVKNILVSSLISKKRLCLSTFEVSVVSKYFKRLLVNVDFSDALADHGHDHIDEHNYDFIKFHGTVIVAECYPYRNGSFGSGELILTVITSKKNIKNRDILIKQIAKESKLYRDAQPTGVCYKYDRSQWRKIAGVKRRTFENTFIGSSEKEQIFRGMDSFITRRDWYEKHNLAYHYGILLYGPPGTGKSTLIQAIANKYGAEPYIISRDIVDGIRELRNDGRYANNTGLKIVVIEDIDACAFASDREISNFIKRLDSEDDSEKTIPKHTYAERKDILEKSAKVDTILHDRRMMSTVLNEMDGLDALQDVVYIFTTNNIAAIDPAIKRAGRLDTIVEIGYATDETMNEFCKYHFDKELPKDRQIKSEQIFATMQLDVMQGFTFEQIIAKYTNPLY